MQDESRCAPNAPRDGCRLGIADSESLLRSEVAFWRDMIQSCETDHPPESLERMRQALALAEFRLQELHRPGCPG